MYTDLFKEFLKSGDSLRVYEDGKLIFASKKDQLLPLMEYLSRCTNRKVTIFDKVIGNAAALLAVKANCGEVYSPLGSQLAVETLVRHGVKYRITEIIPFILKPDGKDMCPMEKLSLKKEPQEFFEVISARRITRA